MKKYLLLCSIVSAGMFSTAQAQIKKGAIFLGGDIGGSTATTESAGVDYSKQSGFTITPVFGRAIKENLIFGAYGTVAVSTYKVYDPSTNSEQKTRGYGGGFFLRKYKPLGSSGFSVFAEARAGVLFEKREDSFAIYANYQKVKTFSATITAYPGLSYTVSRKFQLEAGFNNLLSMKYSRENRTVGAVNNSVYKTTGFDLYSSIDNFSSLYLGFRVLLN